MTLIFSLSMCKNRRVAALFKGLWIRIFKSQNYEYDFRNTSFLFKILLKEPPFYYVPYTLIGYMKLKCISEIDELLFIMKTELNNC